jgi:SAM-dependent methyltransferase
MPRTQPFDDHPDAYEAWFEEHPYVYRSEVEAVRRLMPAAARAVEIGIGTGRFALPLGIREGVDPSAEMRRIATGKGLVVHDAVAEALPFEDESADVALMVTTVCFVDDVRASFREAHRVLRPGGAIVVGLVDRDSPLGRVYVRMKEASRFYRPATFYSAAEVTALLEATGFADVEVVQTVFGPIDAIDEVQAPREGYGDGGFVAIKATKKQ